MWPTSCLAGEIERHRGRPVAILASGDPFHFGVGKQLAAFIPVEEFICLPQPSAFSLAAARMGWSLQDVSLVTLHGRALHGIIRHLQPGARILALSWDNTTPAKLAELLNGRRMGQSLITVLESMSGPRERIRQAKASNFGIEPIVPLNTIAIEVIAEPETATIALAPGLDDGFFEHDGQLTKREIRAVTLSSLEPHQAEMCGIAICWQSGEAWYLAVRGPTGDSVLDPETTLAQLKLILEDPSVGKVNQNIKYDWQVLLLHGVYGSHWSWALVQAWPPS